MDQTIRFVLSNLPLVALGLALLIAIIGAFCLVTRRSRAELTLRMLMLFPVGLAGLWGFYYHIFMPQQAASFIGWANSPFQWEVGMANLGLGIAGVIGAWRSKDFGYWLATTLFTTALLWGAAIGHVRQMMVADNFAPGNAGAIFWTDILIPAFLIIFLIVYKAADRRSRS